MSNVNAVTFTIVVVLFLVVTLTGFAAARWRRAEDMLHLNEWGLGGRGFGTFVAWFLLGGDLYTAYTFIAVPAAMFGAGAVTGYFAVAYTIIVFPIALIFLPRLWSIARWSFQTILHLVKTYGRLFIPWRARATTSSEWPSP